MLCDSTSIVVLIKCPLRNWGYVQFQARSCACKGYDIIFGFTRIWVSDYVGVCIVIVLSRLGIDWSFVEVLCTLVYCCRTKFQMHTMNFVRAQKGVT